MKLNYDLTKLEYGLKQLEYSYSYDMINSLIVFYEMLIEKNKVMNLTAITEFDDVVEKHFIDSLAINIILNKLDFKNVLDLGTGAGFPGIPLSIFFPDINFTLMDSLNKRINFINEVKDELNLENVNPIHGRAEEAARNKNHREKYHICLSRAVANISTLSEYCLPFVEVGGYFVSYKSGDIEDEISNGKEAIKKLGGKIVNVKSFILPNSDIERSFVIIEKIKSTNKTYPRKAGTPSKNPL